MRIRHRSALAEEHRGTERALESSGISYTILRNGWYTENYTGSIPGALAGGAFPRQRRQREDPSAARADYAKAAVAVVTSGGHEGRTYELAGDQAWTLADLAAEISRQTGRTIPYKDLPEAEYAAVLKSVGVPDGMAHAIAGWDVAVSQGALFDDTRQLSALTGQPHDAAVRSGCRGAEADRLTCLPAKAGSHRRRSFRVVSRRSFRLQAEEPG